MKIPTQKNSRGFELKESAIIVAEKEAVSSIDEYLLVKRLRRRKQKLATVRKRRS